MILGKLLPSGEAGLKTGAISCWEFENFNDSHGSYNLSGSGGITQVYGKLDYGYIFDSYAHLFLSFYPNLGRYEAQSIAFWLYPYAWSGDRIGNNILGKFSVDANYVSSGFKVSVWENEIMYGLYNTNGTFNSLSAYPWFQPNTWRHIVITNDGSGNANNYKIYSNGSLLSSTTGSNNLSANPTTTGGFRIANVVNAFNEYSFYGILDQVAIWSRELSAKNVSDLYNSGSGLTYTYWTF